MSMKPLVCNSKHAPTWIGRTNRPYDFQSPCGGKEFALFLILGDEAITPTEQEDLSTKLVRQGCRYAVCFGVACSSWDDSIDWVGVMDKIEGRPGPFVMTTWHEDETIGDVAECFVLNTTFDDWEPQNFVVLIVGGTAELEAEVRNALELAFQLALELASHPESKE